MKIVVPVLNTFVYNVDKSFLRIKIKLDIFYSTKRSLYKS